MADDNPKALLAYIAQETSLFYDHIRKATEAHSQGGELPNSLFGARAIKSLEKAAGRKREKGTPKLSGYNLFMRHRMALLKEQGIKPEAGEGKGRNAAFTQVTEEWKTIGEKEKAEWNVKAKAASAGEGPEAPKVVGGGDVGTSSDSSDSSSSDEEEKRKKKKKKKVCFFFFQGKQAP
jgi:hypothetical protein